MLASEYIAIFYQSLKVKYKAADSCEQYVSTAGHKKQSLYLL